VRSSREAITTSSRSKALAISQCDRDAIAEGVEKIVLAVGVFVADAKALDLLKQAVSQMSLVDDRFLEATVGVFDNPRWT
jgi:hypothetical protein